MLLHLMYCFLAWYRLRAQTNAIVCGLFQLCPKFLHTNSTSHTWPFSAIAELIGMWINSFPEYLIVILFPCCKTFFLQVREGVDPVVTIQNLTTCFFGTDWLFSFLTAYVLPDSSCRGLVGFAGFFLLNLLRIAKYRRLWDQVNSFFSSPPNASLLLCTVPKPRE